MGTSELQAPWNLLVRGQRQVSFWVRRSQGRLCKVWLSALERYYLSKDDGVTYCHWILVAGWLEALGAHDCWYFAFYERAAPPE
jgi:hypothetical protein